MDQPWPANLWVVRHGESAGNVARAAANAAGLPMINIAERDVDVPLSATGERQSAALGRWFSELPADRRPTVVLVSPYLRSRHTASLIEAAGGVAPASPMIVDERLREKEFGILDRLTRLGVEQRYPEQAELRARLGKFYFRPPGGESWCDVILRLRSVLGTINLHHGGPQSRVLVVGHQVIVLCLRYLLEHLDEAQILAIDGGGEVANCGVTSYEYDGATGGTGELVLRGCNFLAPLVEAGVPVTSSPDAPSGIK